MVAVDASSFSGNGCIVTLLMSTLPEPGKEMREGEEEGEADIGRKRK